MALSKSFKLAELIRHIEYDSSDDVIKTSKRTEDKNKKEVQDTKTATTGFNLDTFAHADFREQDISLQCLEEQISIQRKSCWFTMELRFH